MTHPYNALYGPPQAPVDNALYGDPKSMTMSDMLRFVESNAMSPLAKGERPADPLRWLADAVGQNKDLPAPQFFMDPRALSARNMLHSGLNTAANWLDGTKDPSLIGPQEMVSPLGLGVAGSMGTGVRNAMQRASKAPDKVWYHGTDAEFDALQPRRAPPYSGGSSVPATWLTSKPRVAQAFAEAGGQKGRVIDATVDAPNLEVVERAFRSPNWETMDPILQRAKEAGKDGVLFKRSQDHPDSIGLDPRVWNASDVIAMFNPEGIKPRGSSVMADNAKGSAPGTIINSLDMSEAARMARAKEMGFDTETPLYHGTKANFDEFRPSEKGKFGSGVYFSPERQFADEWTSGNGRVIEAYGRGKMADDAAWAKARDAEYSADGSRSMFEIENAAAKRLQSEGYAGVSSKARGESVVFDPKDIRSTQAAFDPAKRDSANLLAASPSASAPGLAANSTQQQDDQGVMSILRRYGLAE